MKYQVMIAGFGGQGTVFLVKVLSYCADARGIKFLGTENHGMSQRGGSVSCFIKVGDFYNPVIDHAQADLLIGLEMNESLRNVQFLKPEGTLVMNAAEPCKHLKEGTVYVDAFSRAEAGAFPIQALNVYMLGVAFAKDPNFPFTLDEIKEAVAKVNPKVAEQNMKVIDMAIEDIKEG